jgi:hypothetical protein
MNKMKERSKDRGQQKKRERRKDIEIERKQGRNRTESAFLVVQRSFVKRTVARDFRPSVFSSIDPTQGLDSRAKVVSHMDSYSPRQSLQKSSKSVSAGSMTPLNPKMKSRIPKLFLFKVYWYGMEIFPYEIVLLLRTWNKDLKFQRGLWSAETISAWSMTPLKRFQRGQYTLKFEYCRFSRRIRGHIWNGFMSWIRP